MPTDTERLDWVAKHLESISYMDSKGPTELTWYDDDGYIRTEEFGTTKFDDETRVRQVLDQAMAL